MTKATTTIDALTTEDIQRFTEDAESDAATIAYLSMFLNESLESNLNAKRGFSEKHPLNGEEICVRIGFQRRTLYAIEWLSGDIESRMWALQQKLCDLNNRLVEAENAAEKARLSNAA